MVNKENITEKTTLATPTRESYFDGNGFGFLGWGLLGVLVTICTLLIMASIWLLMVVAVLIS